MARTTRISDSGSAKDRAILTYTKQPNRQREIDWMALHGINMPLAFTGQEYVWALLFDELGVTDEEQQRFFVGPGSYSLCSVIIM